MVRSCRDRQRSIVLQWKATDNAFNAPGPGRDDFSLDSDTETCYPPARCDCEKCL